MKIEVNVEKRYFFGILAVVLLIGVGVLVYAIGAVPNPVGHALSQVQGYFTGDASLEASLGRFCQSDGTNCANTGAIGALSSPAISDDFVSGLNLPWATDTTTTSIASTTNHPGIITVDKNGGYFALQNAINASQDFDVIFVVRSNSNKAISEYPGFTVGLFSDTGRSNAQSTAPDKVVFETSPASGPVVPGKIFTELKVNGVLVNANFVDAPTDIKQRWIVFRIKKTGTSFAFYIDDMNNPVSTLTSATLPSRSMYLGFNIYNQDFDVDLVSFSSSSLSRS
ncbi:hypothetical protein J4217_00915 [Candidatus Pacearchaeota archaeon]|nr:hypothetical protein [Candidatus Pacearchaeota archaeon]